MSAKNLILTVYKQNYLRQDWSVDFDGEEFAAFLGNLAAELSAFGMVFSWQKNEAFTIDVSSYADMLNVVRISSPSDGVTSRCVGHIIGKSQHLDLCEDVRRAVNRVAFAPETIPPDDHNRKICHNCGCGC
jgi:hypothetical protein